MWYINLSRGVSHTALCEAVLKVSKDKMPQFIRLLNGCMKRDIRLCKYTGIDNGPGINFFLLHEQCKGIAPFDRKQAIELADDMSPVFDRIFCLSGENTVHAFDVIVYLALIILLEKLSMKERIRMFFPRIGTDSAGVVFSILKGFTIILDPAAPVVTPLCSAFLVYYADLFIDAVLGNITAFMEVPDPFHPGIQIQVFECDDWNVSRDADGFDYDIIGVLDTNIDDCTPEIISGVMSDILVSGALDYTITPVTMKKGRSGFHVQVLCKYGDMKRIAAELLNQTSSFGIRMQTLLRKKLKREIKTIQTIYGEVHVKLGYIGNKIIKAVPEFDDLKMISGTRGISLFSLYNEIMGEIKKGIDCFSKDDKITRF